MLIPFLTGTVVSLTYQKWTENECVDVNSLPTKRKRHLKKRFVRRASGAMSKTESLVLMELCRPTTYFIFRTDGKTTYQQRFAAIKTWTFLKTTDAKRKQINWIEIHKNSISPRFRSLRTPFRSRFRIPLWCKIEIRSAVLTRFRYHATCAGILKIITLRVLHYTAFLTFIISYSYVYRHSHFYSLSLPYCRYPLSLPYCHSLSLPYCIYSRFQT